MAYYYEGLASCESDMRILSTLLDDCAHAEGMADDLGGDLTSLASATNGAILLGGPDSLTSAASTLGGGLCDAVRAIRQACESALSAVSSELYRFLGHGSPPPRAGCEVRERRGGSMANAGTCTDECRSERADHVMSSGETATGAARGWGSTTRRRSAG